MKRITLLFTLLLCLNGFSQTSKQKIQSRLNTDMEKFGLTTKDVADWVIESEVTSETTKITNYYIVQRHQGIEIFNAQSNISMKNGNVINIGNNFKKNIDKKVNATIPALSVLEAIASAYSRLGITNPTSFTIAETINDKSFKLSDGLGTRKEPILAKLVYQSIKDDRLKLAWAFQFHSPDRKHLWSIRIDALNGNILEKNDLIISCSFGKIKKINYADNYPFNFEQNSVPNALVSPVQINAGSYRVIPYNYESPNHSPFQLIASPSNAIASPKGWHDTNTLAGTTASLKYSYTRGNNVWAQEDANGDDGIGGSPDGGSSLNFDFPYGGQTLQPTAYVQASTTNLFYMANIMHDVWYQYGFNEVSGNFQDNNYGKIGRTNPDYVLANSQDGYSQADPTLNNAQYYPTIDGTSPYIEMFLWNSGAPPTNFVTVNSPVSISGAKEATTNVFEGTDRIPVPIFPNGITSDLVLYKNNPTPPGYNSACQIPTNAAALNGKIALIKRGGCFFNLKVKNAQDAGAKAVIVMDSIPNNPTRLSMSSTGVLGITIPAVFITKEKGDAFIAEMENGTVNVKLEVQAGLYLYADGDFDNGIIAHEYGHGISSRLTGGRLTISCLSAPEQMGEGWSDWIALMMQLKTGDSGETAKGIGTYAVNEATTGEGIRNYPYSTNMTINPLTFANTNGKTFIDPDDGIEKVRVHAVGEVWAATLWDLTWAYIGKYGFSSNIYTGNGGNNKVMQLIIDAMKLQPCNPSFIQARDAVIAADQAITGGQDYCMIWKVFARRGLGVNASSGDNSGDRTNVVAIKDQVEDFAVPSIGPNCTLAVNQFVNNNKISIYPNPAPKGLLNIRIDEFVGKVNIQVADMNGRIVYKLAETDFNIEKTINLNSLQKGIYIIKLSNETLSHSEKIIIK